VQAIDMLEIIEEGLVGEKIANCGEARLSNEFDGQSELLLAAHREYFLYGQAYRIEDLEDANFYIITVPTPIDDHNLPDLTPLISATRTIGNVLKKGDYVVYESTVYPGCTEEDCIPVLEELSGLKFIDDFKVGFSAMKIYKIF